MMTDSAVSSKTTAEVAETGSLSCLETALFAALGLGPSWVLVGCIYQEVPAFEIYLPEEFCIAAYLSLAISFSVLFIFANLLYIRYFGPAPHRIAVPFTIGLEIFSIFFCATVWNVTFDNMSYMLYLCAFLGGGVGGLQMVLVMPWMSRFKPACITAFRVGTDIGTLSAALLALVQQPGSGDKAMFGPSVFFVIFGVVMVLPVSAYVTILNGGYGLRGEWKGDAGARGGAEAEVGTRQCLDPLCSSLSSVS